MKPCVIAIALTIPDNEAYTALTTLQRLGAEISDLRRADVWRFETEDGYETTLLERVRTLESMFNPNKHEMLVREHDAREPGEVWIAELNGRVIERPVVVSGRELPGVVRAERYTGWRLFIGEGISAPTEVVRRAAATLLCQSAFQRAII